MDRRLTPANGRVAAAHLEGQVEADRFVEGIAQRVTVPFTDLCRAPRGARDRQILLGDGVTVFEVREGVAFVQCEKDGFVGYVNAEHLGDLPEPTHWVVALTSHIYSEPDMKSPETAELVFGSAVCVIAHTGRFQELATGGYVPKQHLWPITKRFNDPVTAAQMFFGVPYLWGGNTSRGLDCSGLVQAALLAAGKDCPGDSDLQEAALGRRLEGGEASARGDLVFWKGHVGIMVDGETLIHANSHHMAVAYEPLEVAIRRIEAQGGGPVTSRKRL